MKLENSFGILAKFENFENFYRKGSYSFFCILYVPTFAEDPPENIKLTYF